MFFSKFSLLLFFITSITFSQNKQLKDHILFYSSFNGKTTADISVGDSLIYTAENYKKTNDAKPGLHNPNVVLAKNKGLTGDALHFKKKNTTAIYFSGYKNLGYSSESWSGSFSFWLQLDPDTDLEPGYCDPINLTDVRYDDAALWVDFTKDDKPRQFRLGVLGDLDIRKKENKINDAELEKRLVRVINPPFKSGKWTHVVITYSEVNTNKSICKLYVDGQLKGAVKDVNDPFTWEEENAKIMLGLSYVGLMDELTAFDKTLDANEVKSIYKLKNGIKSLFE
ncbi:LamG-like jellyroll fold domain-containing protein [uncultured Maribacter sp.]|uniref:LamG-like jellyroll fold domain-containing protein n=1 Tax=uncultured Maribacter sp. TaxID=431308 RepID=UPI00261878B5|nr:LamG-like jellyroll fold domain-containing protein [uncultured Maribacter sp.]